MGPTKQPLWALPAGAALSLKAQGVQECCGGGGHGAHMPWQGWSQMIPRDLSFRKQGWNLSPLHMAVRSVDLCHRCQLCKLSAWGHPSEQQVSCGWDMSSLSSCGFCGCVYVEAGWGLSAFIAMKTQPYRIFGMQQKQLVLRVKFKVIQASLKKKKKERKKNLK